MLYAILQETYAWPLRKDAKPLETRPVDSKDGFEAAKECAEKLAAKFDHHEFEGNSRYQYYWGHDQDNPYFYRFVIKPAT